MRDLVDFVQFASSQNPLSQLANSSRQGRYVRRYLLLMGARSVAVEHRYLDLDFLEDVAARRMTSPKHVDPPKVDRVHVFGLPQNEVRELLELSLREISTAGSAAPRSELTDAAGGDSTVGAAGEPMSTATTRRGTRENPRSQAASSSSALERLSAAYLGFITLRPVDDGRPFGRSVLARWPRRPTRRVGLPARPYRVSLAGVPLVVHGLAWQEQLPRASCCGTVALWTALQCSGLSERHRVASAAELTAKAGRLESGSKAHLRGTRLQTVVRASTLLSLIEQQGFEPSVLAPDASDVAVRRSAFRFAVSTFVRSGFPVLLTGSIEGKNPRPRLDHALCCIAFRSPPSVVPSSGPSVARDEKLEFIYCHDDTIGPAVRHCVIEIGCAPRYRSFGVKLVTQSPRVPPTRFREILEEFGVDLGSSADAERTLVPLELIAAMPPGVTLKIDALRLAAENVAARVLDAHCESVGRYQGVVHATRFCTASEYLRSGLRGSAPGSTAAGNSGAIGRARWQAFNRVRPVGRMIAVIRFRTDGGSGPHLLGDYMLDAGVSNPSDGVLGWVPYDKPALDWAQRLHPSGGHRRHATPVVFEHLFS